MLQSDFRRYLVDIDSVTTHQQSTDYLVIGAGIAGLRAAIEASQHGSVTLVTKGTVEDSNTWHAQGGIASVLEKTDKFESHIADTLRTGGGLSDEKTVAIVVSQGPGLIRQLLDWGCAFDDGPGRSCHRLLRERRRQARSQGLAGRPQPGHRSDRRLSVIQLRRDGYGHHDQVAGHRRGGGSNDCAGWR